MPTQKEFSDLLSQQAIQGEKISSIEQSCSDIKTCLLGNGKPGIVVRLDRLEQREQKQDRLFWLAVTTFVTVAIKMVIDLAGFTII